MVLRHQAVPLTSFVVVGVQTHAHWSQTQYRPSRSGTLSMSESMRW